MRIRELRPWGRMDPSRLSIVRELLVYGRGLIVHIAFDDRPEDVLDRLQDLVHDELASFVAFLSTRARGGK